jgi:hypothetical protein
MSGEEFRYKCESYIHAIDQYCSRSLIDPVTGESRTAEEQDNENQLVAGVMWSDEAITLSAVTGKGCDPYERHLHHLKKMLEVCPTGRGPTLHTTSEMLVREGEKFRGWVKSGKIGEMWDQIHSDWKNILGHMEQGGKMIGIVLRSQGEFPQQESALQQRCQERILKMEVPWMKIQGNLLGRESKSGGKPQEDSKEIQ